MERLSSENAPSGHTDKPDGFLDNSASSPVRCSPAGLRGNYLAVVYHCRFQLEALPIGN
jgi:hypothetical protein